VWGGGGSLAVNTNLYNRGTRRSYPLWAEDVGDDSYTFDNWLPLLPRKLT
jgi:hypothetical protein